MAASKDECGAPAVENNGEVNGKHEAGADQQSPEPQRAASFKEESNFVSDLKDHEKKALQELKVLVEEAILKGEFAQKNEKEIADRENPENENAAEAQVKSGVVEEETSVPVVAEEEEKTSDENVVGEHVEKAEESLQAVESAAPNAEGVPVVENVESKTVATPVGVEDVYLWGVPLLHSKGDERTNVVLLKFLRARDFKVQEAFEMVKNTINWRKSFKADSIVEENLGQELEGVAYMSGWDKEGHPVCYNVYGVFQEKGLYQKAFGDDEKRQRFLRWRVQFLEKGIEQLSFRPGGVNSMVQITDLKNSPGLAKKELRQATKQALDLLQDNYPEFVARKIFINVPWWYFALSTMISPFLTQRTKSKFVIAHPSRITETLFKYISPENVPVQYGGLKRANDLEFSGAERGVSELIVKAGAKEVVEISATEEGTTLVWDLIVVGWEVMYKEEFVPDAEGCYTVIIQKEKKMTAHDEPVRNSFRIGEPGKVLLTIQNTSSRKKKLVFRTTLNTPKSQLKSEL